MIEPSVWFSKRNAMNDQVQAGDRHPRGGFEFILLQCEA
jgi:hypothetical protein